MFKWTVRLLLILVAIVAIAWLAKDSVIRIVTENRIEDDTGLRVQIGRMSTAPGSAAVTLRDVKVYNTAEFGGTLFLDIPELHVQIEPAALGRRKLRIERLRVNLAEISIVRNQSGRTNIFSIAKEVEERKRKKRRRGGRDDFEFEGIDMLTLSLGKARFIDIGNPSATSEVSLNMTNQAFPDMRTEADVYGMLFMVWLRSGGRFSLGPNDLAKDYLERKKNELEATFRDAMRQAREPEAKP